MGKCDMIANSTEKTPEFGVMNSNWQLKRLVA